MYFLEVCQSVATRKPKIVRKQCRRMTVGMETLSVAGGSMTLTAETYSIITDSLFQIGK